MSIAGAELSPTRADVPAELPPVRLLGVRIDPVSTNDFLRRIEAFVTSGGSDVVHFCPADPLVTARANDGYRTTLNAGSLNAPDGMSVVWALRLLGRPASRLAGTDALHLVCAWGIERGLRHFFLGGAPDVLQRLVESLEREHPGLCIAGAESPPFVTVEELDTEGSAKRIRQARADVVWIGLGAPKQEVVAARLQALDCAPVILCVGAAFDFASGAKRRAPGWMQNVGLEWLHRLASEPRRLWRRYLVGNPRFIACVLADRLRRGVQ